MITDIRNGSQPVDVGEPPDHDFNILIPNAGSKWRVQNALAEDFITGVIVNHTVLYQEPQCLVARINLLLSDGNCIGMAMVDIIVGCVADNNVGTGPFQSTEHRFVHLRIHPIVAVDKSDNIGTSSRYAIVAGSRHTLILLMNHLDTRIFFGVAIANHGAVVGRTVVNENDFNIGKCLGQKRINAFWQILFDIIYRYNYTNFRKIRFAILHIIVFFAKLIQLDEIIKSHLLMCEIIMYKSGKEISFI